MVIAKPFSKVHPNILSLFGIVPPILFLWLMVTGNYFWAFISLLGLFADTIDGAVARMTGKTSAFGALLDSSIDRVSDALYIVAFAAAGLVSYPLVIVALVLSYLISYIRSRAELAGNGKFVLNVGIIERPERMVAVVLALLASILFPNAIFLGANLATHIFYLLCVLSLVTIVQRVSRSWSLLR